MNDITVQELKDKLDNKEDFVFVDVREPVEYQNFNLGAKLIPLGSLLQSLDQLDPDKDKELVVHCRSGKRSATAKSLLEERGYTKVRNLIGGVLEWVAIFH